MNRRQNRKKLGETWWKAWLSLIIKLFRPWLSSPLIIRLFPHLDHHESVILSKTRIKGLILIRSAATVPSAVELTSFRQSDREVKEEGGLLEWCRSAQRCLTLMSKTIRSELKKTWDSVRAAWSGNPCRLVLHDQPVGDWMIDESASRHSNI